MADPHDLIVIGTGVAGTKIAQTCRRAGWRVAIVDHLPYGGTCMLRGCDPKKLLWTVAELVDRARRFAADGFSAPEIGLSWQALMRFKEEFLEAAPAAVERQLVAAGIETLHGRARFAGRNAVAVNGRTLEARHIAIAAGSVPARLPIPGAELLQTSDQFLEMRELPRSLVFVGGGYISFEFAHVAVRAGAQVTILHEDDRPLAGFESSLVARMLEKSRRIGIDVRLRSRVERIERCSAGVRVHTARSGPAQSVEASAAIHGAGRVPDIDDLDPAAGGIERDGRKLRLDRSLRSASNRSVYAAGDAAAAGPMLTPVSELDAEVVAHNLLAAKSRQPDYTGVPSVVFTIPALASVGLTEEQARASERAFRVLQGDISGWYSARRVQEDTAAYKVLLEEKTGRILGAHLIGPSVEEAINPFAFAIRLGLAADDLRRLVPAYPSEASNIGYMLG